MLEWTSALGGGQWSASQSGRLTSGEITPMYTFIINLGEIQNWSVQCRVEETVLLLSGIKTWSCSPWPVMQRELSRSVIVIPLLRNTLWLTYCSTKRLTDSLEYWILNALSFSSRNKIRKCPSQMNLCFCFVHTFGITHSETYNLYSWWSAIKLSNE